MADTVPVPEEPPHSRRRHDREATSWIVGIVLILLGVAFLLQNAGYVVLTGNWWAIFIYLAAIASFVNAWRSYRSQGEFGTKAAGSLTWGLVFTVVASIFLFNLSWDVWWPAILVAVGLGIVVGYVLRSRGQEHEDSGIDQG